MVRFYNLRTTVTMLFAFFTGFTASIAWTEEARRFLAGAQAVDISPQRLPMDSAGSMTPRKSKSVHDPLMARCLVLDDGANSVAMVICDSCMIPRELIDAAKSMAARETGISTERILVAATHSHSAVTVARVFQSEVEEDYTAFLTKQIVQGIKEAYANRRPARIGWGLGHCPQHVFNRRWHLRPGTPLDDPFDLGTDRVRMNPNPNHKSLLKPAGPTDPEIPVLAVQGLDGVPIAVWCNYALHYVGGIPDNAFSGDYFGEFARQFTALIQPKGNEPFMAAMTNGASGDVNNVNFFEDRKTGQPFEQIRLVAHDVAKAAYNAYQRIDYQDWAKLDMCEEELELGVRRPTETEIARAKGLLATAGPGPWSDRRLIYAKETLDIAEYPATVSVKLQAIRIGDLGIVSTPCETFVETGLAIKEQSPLPLTFLIELANGYNGYLPTPEQHALGGYETWRAKSSYLAVDAEPKIRETLLRMLRSLTTNAISAKKPDQPEAIADALTIIESTRGGRHWVDAPTAAPKSPKESQACFQIESGLDIELVAAEPLVLDPVAIAFDQLGRMFVVEYADYPEGPPNPRDPPLSRVVMLEDVDGDGKMDRRHVFADQLDFAHSLMPFRGGILVGAKSELIFLKDTNDDHRADIREVLFSGFVPAHAQMQIGCPQWGIDNWVYCNYGPGKVVAKGSAAPAEERELPRKEFRFHPLTLAFGPASGLGQYGNTIDALGRRFFCTNRNPIIHAPISDEDLRRNPYAVFNADQYDVAPAGEKALVYPLVEMKSNYLSHAGSHTAACGTTAFLGHALGPHFENSIFVCEPIGHLITRTNLLPEGPILKGVRAREKADFLASTDTWFRPVSLATGPDGALYVADMYRLWVEHPKFLPPEIGRRLDWRAGEDRGRIWRVVSATGPKPPPFQPPHSTEEIVKLLEHPNGWQRQLAQRLLVEQQAVEAVPLVRSLIRDADQLAQKNRSGSSTEQFAVQRALWILDGLHALESADVLMGMQSKYSIVRQASVELARRFLDDSAVFEKLCSLAEDADAMVRFQVALSAGVSSDPRISRVLAKIAAKDQTHDWTITAILTSAEKRGTSILRAIFDSPDQPLYPSPSAVRLIRELSAMVGACGDREELESWFRLVAAAANSSVSSDNSASSPIWWTNAALSGLANGLSRHKGSLGKTSLARLLKDPIPELVPSAAAISQLLEQSTIVALDPDSPLSDRVAAVELLGYQGDAQVTEIIPRLFDSAQPVELQMAALRSMQKGGSDWIAKLVLDKWPTLGPVVRDEALSLLLRRTETTKVALEAMAAGTVSSAMVSIDQRVTLLQHPDATIKQLSQRVFGSGVSENRKGVIERYHSALSLDGDSSRGKQVFNKVCANCHRLNGHGHEVGPDLSDTRNRSREALLYDILDPNQKLEPKFTAYQVVTDEGVALQGLIVAETPEVIVLRLAEGKEETISRQSIEIFRSTGQSLMPEGVEKEIGLQEMADLLKLLKGT